MNTETFNGRGLYIADFALFSVDKKKTASQRRTSPLIEVLFWERGNEFWIGYKMIQCMFEEAERHTFDTEK